MKETWKLWAKAKVEDAGFSPFVTFQRHSESGPWDREHSGVTCKDNQSSFVCEWTPKRAELAAEPPCTPEPRPILCRAARISDDGGALATISTRSLQKVELAWGHWNHLSSCCLPTMNLQVKTSADWCWVLSPQKQRISGRKEEKKAVVTMLRLWGAPRGSEREDQPGVPEHRISAKEASAGKYGTTLESRSSGFAPPKGETAAAPRRLQLIAKRCSANPPGISALDHNTVFCDPEEKRELIKTWMMADRRAKSSCDRQLQVKQPFLCEELHWWHSGVPQIKQTVWRLGSCGSGWVSEQQTPSKKKQSELKISLLKLFWEPSNNRRL